MAREEMENQLKIIKEKITSLYSELGKEYYRCYSENPDLEFEQVIYEISKIKMKQKPPVLSQEMKFCFQCGAKLTAGVCFCEKCGVRLAKAGGLSGDFSESIREKEVSAEKKKEKEEIPFITAPYHSRNEVKGSYMSSVSEISTTKDVYRCKFCNQLTDGRRMTCHICGHQIEGYRMV